MAGEKWGNGGGKDHAGQVTHCTLRNLVRYKNSARLSVKISKHKTFTKFSAVQCTLFLRKGDKGEKGVLGKDNVTLSANFCPSRGARRG